MTVVLPVSIDPQPDESVSSMLGRLAAITGLPQRVLYPYPVGRDLSLRQRRLLSSVLGVPVRRLAAHTLGPRLGRLHAPLHRDSRLTSVDFRRSDALICPRCGIGTLWSGLVWISCCPTCRVVLSDAGRTTIQGGDPVHAWDMQHSYVKGLRTRSEAQTVRLHRLRRILRLHVLIDVPPGPAPLRPDLSWQSPSWMARFADQAWPASATVQATRDHIGDVALAHLGALGGDDLTLADARTILHHQLRSTRITENEIPDYLRDGFRAVDGDAAGEDLGHGIARALRREAIHAHAGQRPTVNDLDARYGDLRKRPMVTTYAHHLGHTAPGLRILAGQAHHLTTSGPCDFAYRRSVLTTLHSVPTSWLAHTSMPRTPRNQTLAAAWIWMEVAQGTLQDGPHHAGMRRELRAFNHSLLPEDRLVLIEYGHQLLGAIADDVTHDAPRTARPTRSAASFDVG